MDEELATYGTYRYYMHVHGKAPPKMDWTKSKPDRTQYPDRAPPPNKCMHLIKLEHDEHLHCIGTVCIYASQSVATCMMCLSIRSIIYSASHFCSLVTRHLLK